MSLTSLDDFHENVAAFNHRHRSPNSEQSIILCALIRAQLVTEELSELLEAAFNMDQRGMTEETVTALVDAYGDLLYVVIGTGAAFDLDSTQILRAVCKSNDTKAVTGDPRVRDKGKGYKAPDFTSIVRDYLHG